LHSKTLLIDDTLGVVGSYNLDNRSARIDFEVAAVIINDTVQDLKEDFIKTIAESHLETPEQYQSRSLIRRFIEHTLSLFSSLV